MNDDFAPPNAVVERAPAELAAGLDPDATSFDPSRFDEGMDSLLATEPLPAEVSPVSKSDERPPPRRGPKPQATDAVSPLVREEPADLNTERALLGCCLLKADCIPIAIEQVSEEDFYDFRHRAVFAAIVRLVQRSEATDVVSVLGDLKAAGSLDRVGAGFVAELMQLQGHTQAIEQYVLRVAKLAALRRVLRATQVVQDALYAPRCDPDEAMAFAQTTFGEALKQAVKQGAVPIQEILPTVWSQIRAAQTGDGVHQGIPTGYDGIERILHGFKPTDLMILAARPAMGKSALALNFALNVATTPRAVPIDGDTRHGVLIFSLEMGKEQLVQRFLSAWAQVPLGKVQGHSKLNPDEERALLEAKQDLEVLRIEIDETPGVTIPEVRARAKRMALAGPLDLIVVDYLQLMRGTGGDKQPREQQVAEVSRGLKGLAKDMKCTVLALAQLNRGVEHRQGNKDAKSGDDLTKSARLPRVSDLRESGSIEQDADIITFIHRDSVYTKDKTDKTALFIIAKHRAGELGDVHLVYEGEFTRFYPTAMHQRLDA